MNKIFLESAFAVRLWALWNLWFLSVSATLLDVIVRSGAYARPLGFFAVAIGTYTGLLASYRLSRTDWPHVFGVTKAAL